MKPLQGAFSSYIFHVRAKRVAARHLVKRITGRIDGTPAPALHCLSKQWPTSAESLTYLRCQRNAPSSPCCGILTQLNPKTEYLNTPCVLIKRARKLMSLLI